MLTFSLNGFISNRLAILVFSEYNNTEREDLMKRERMNSSTKYPVVGVFPIHMRRRRRRHQMSDAHTSYIASL